MSMLRLQTVTLPQNCSRHWDFSWLARVTSLRHLDMNESCLSHTQLLPVMAQLSSLLSLKVRHTGLFACRISTNSLEVLVPTCRIA